MLESNHQQMKNKMASYFHEKATELEGLEKYGDVLELLDDFATATNVAMMDWEEVCVGQPLSDDELPIAEGEGISLSQLR